MENLLRWQPDIILVQEAVLQILFVVILSGRA